MPANVAVIADLDAAPAAFPDVHSWVFELTRSAGVGLRLPGRIMSLETFHSVAKLPLDLGNLGGELLALPCSRRCCRRLIDAGGKIGDDRALEDVADPQLRPGSFPYMCDDPRGL